VRSLFLGREKHTKEVGNGPTLPNGAMGSDDLLSTGIADCDDFALLCSSVDLDFGSYLSHEDLP
jgi:hypothetical protein